MDWSYYHATPLIKGKWFWLALYMKVYNYNIHKSHHSLVCSIHCSQKTSHGIRRSKRVTSIHVQICRWVHYICMYTARLTLVIVFMPSQTLSWCQYMQCAWACFTADIIVNYTDTACLLCNRLPMMSVYPTWRIRRQGRWLQNRKSSRQPYAERKECDDLFNC